MLTNFEDYGKAKGKVEIPGENGWQIVLEIEIYIYTYTRMHRAL